MKAVVRTSPVLYWIFTLVLWAIGIMNWLWVHPVPGMIYLVLSLVYLPPVNAFFKNRFRFTIPPVIKIALWVVILWFTLGVSDLGDMID